MRFAKGHGTENDFVILLDPDGELQLTPAFVARLCDRRAGLGADGVLRAVRTAHAAAAHDAAMGGVAPADAEPVNGAQPAGLPSAAVALPPAAATGLPAGSDALSPAAAGLPPAAVGGHLASTGRPLAPAGRLSTTHQAAAEWFMDYRNADGSLAEMCGNGIRVFARYLLDHGLVTGHEFAVATRAGTRLVRAETDGGITVDMGQPLVLGTGRAVLAGRTFDGLAVSLGNPHLACLTGESLSSLDLSQPPLLDPGEFPDGANLELVRLLGDAHVEMLVYERGSGPTRSCGTGAVAAAVAAAHASGAGTPRTWNVDLPGGRLQVTLDGRTSFLSGPAVIVAEGELSRAFLSGAALTGGRARG